MNNFEYEYDFINHRKSNKKESLILRGDVISTIMAILIFASLSCLIFNENKVIKTVAYADKLDLEVPVSILEPDIVLSDNKKVFENKINDFKDKLDFVRYSYNILNMNIKEKEVDKYINKSLLYEKEIVKNLQYKLYESSKINLDCSMYLCAEEEARLREREAIKIYSVLNEVNYMFNIFKSKELIKKINKMNESEKINFQNYEMKKNYGKVIIGSPLTESQRVMYKLIQQDKEDNLLIN